MNPAERDRISVGDRIVYFGQGLVFGVFEVVALVDNEFKGWQKSYPFQLKIKPLGFDKPLLPNHFTRQLQTTINNAF